MAVSFLFEAAHPGRFVTVRIVAAAPVHKLSHESASQDGIEAQRG